MVPTQQELANAWASRMAAFGSVLGFLVGNVDLPAYLPFLGDTQLKLISLFTTTALLGTHAITAWAANERRLLFDNSPSHSAGRMLTGLVQAARELPKPIVDVFRIQCEPSLLGSRLLYRAVLMCRPLLPPLCNQSLPGSHGSVSTATSIISRPCTYLSFSCSDPILQHRLGGRYLYRRSWLSRAGRAR